MVVNRSPLRKEDSAGASSNFDMESDQASGSTVQQAGDTIVQDSGRLQDQQTVVLGNDDGKFVRPGPVLTEATGAKPKRGTKKKSSSNNDDQRNTRSKSRNNTGTLSKASSLNSVASVLDRGEDLLSLGLDDDCEDDTRERNMERDRYFQEQMSNEGVPLDPRGRYSYETRIRSMEDLMETQRAQMLQFQLEWKRERELLDKRCQAAELRAKIAIDIAKIALHDVVVYENRTQARLSGLPTLQKRVQRIENDLEGKIH
ncbi:hypothetical protein QAD02_013932 [Eretmocerus hayati]|uniref:Uncharacterized protein n=1 Tax=Eretmocerus hayati TaxID=131215 RepID=A0ACC2P3J0_9HYME|nr:hypothetical protein QAD02_013932 [Eretmocerus hayati]